MSIHSMYRICNSHNVKGCPFVNLSPFNQRLLHGMYPVGVHATGLRLFPFNSSHFKRIKTQNKKCLFVIVVSSIDDASV